MQHVSMGVAGGGHMNPFVWCAIDHLWTNKAVACRPSAINFTALETLTTLHSDAVSVGQEVHGITHQCH